MLRTTLFRTLAIGATLTTVATASADETEPPALQPIRETFRPEYTYHSRAAGDRPTFDRSTMHGVLTLPLTHRGLAVALRTEYDLDFLGLSKVTPYNESVQLHRLEFGPYLVLSLQEDTSISIDALTVLAGDLKRSRRMNWQVDMRAMYNRRVSSRMAFNVGFEASRLFGPLVPYPAAGAYFGNLVGPVGVRVVLPRELDVYAGLSKRTRLGLLTTFEGRYWWVNGPRLPHSITIRELRSGPRFFWRPLDWLGIDIRAGVVALRYAKLARDRNAENAGRRGGFQSPGFYAAIALPIFL